MDKDIILKVFNKLANDPQILSLLGIPTADGPTKERRISKTRQVGDVADNLPRLAIWSHIPKGDGGVISSYILEIDILIPLTLQKSTGVAYDLEKRIKQLLHKFPIGTGLKHPRIQPDAPTAFGWYKSIIQFPYNYIGN